MVFELAPTWKLGLGMFILGISIIFTGEYMNYKKGGRVSKIRSFMKK